MQQSSYNAQSGNVFMFILLGVVLFAVLVFTVSRGFRSDTTSALTERQAELAAADILNYAQQLERSVNRLRRNGVSESDICFANPGISAINNGAYSSVTECSDPDHHVFTTGGGSVTYKPVLDAWLDTSHSALQGYGEWMYTMSNTVLGVGSGALNVPANSELLAYINYIDTGLCKKINEKLGITSIPDNGSLFAVFGPYGGVAFAGGQVNAAALSGARSGCFENSSVWSGNVFYHVLIERDS